VKRKAGICLATVFDARLSGVTRCPLVALRGSGDGNLPLHGLVSQLTRIALNGNENYPHFIWVLVLSDFAGTGLEGSKPTPRPKFSA